MTTSPIEWCGASTRGFGSVPLGPCVLRHGHDGPLHLDEAGVSWTDPQPASESTEPLCPQATDPCGDEHTETGRRCTRTAGHDTHRSGGTAWTYLANDTIDKWRARAEKAERELSDAHQAWTAVREESAALMQEYSGPAPQRDNRCGSCRQHETVERKDAAARALAKTARRYKQERDEGRAAIQRVRDLHTPVPCECVKCNARRHEGLDDQLCAHCTDLLPQGSRDGGIRYPCPTITALDEPKESA